RAGGASRASTGDPLPDLATGATGVVQDHGHGLYCPCLCRPVRVTLSVSTRRTLHFFLVESPSDTGNTPPGKPLDEDPPHMWGGHRIGVQALQATALPGTDCAEPRAVTGHQHCHQHVMRWIIQIDRTRPRATTPSPRTPHAPPAATIAPWSAITVLDASRYGDRST